MKCVVCDKDLAIWEEPARGNPPLCDFCMRTNQVRPVPPRHMDEDAKHAA